MLRLASTHPFFLSLLLSYRRLHSSIGCPLFLPLAILLVKGGNRRLRGTFSLPPPMERSVRSSLPSRLRQLFSGETSVGVSVRLDSDTPPEVKAFIDKVIQSPIQDIAIPLSGFHWEYDKGSFHHWRPLFLHFDTYFKNYLSSRNDLLLTDEIAKDESPFPKHAVLQILRVMQIILENCPNKSSFDGLEQHFKLLLSSTDPEVLIAALETLSALVKINPSKLHGSSKSVGCGSVNSYLLLLAQGWGSKEEGLGLYSCVVANERLQEEGLCLFPTEFDDENEKSQYWQGSTLYFELNGPTSKAEEPSSSSTNSSSKIIHIPDLHMRKEEDLAIMRECIELYSVPPDLRFPLLTRIRYAHAFRSARTCRLYSRICLLSFIVLVQSNDAHDELASFFANEPEYTNELIRIVRSEESIPGTIRTLAMLALGGAQLAAYISSHERARILSGSSPSFTATHRTILLNVLQKAILSLNNSNDPSSLAFVEALLQFYMLNIVSSSTSGNNLRGWGMLPTFLPLLEDADPGHMHLVCLAVKTIQKLLDYSSSAVPHFRELGGVEMLVQRLHLEVNRVIGLSEGSDGLVVSGECSRINDDLLSSQKRLMRVLLKALGSATFVAANANRSQNSQESTLAVSLAHIFGHVGRFGGEIYHSAVTLMSEMIHKDPTCLSTLFEMGLPDAFLSSVVSGLLPSAKALTCVPNGLGAICLNNKGVEAVKETKALRFLVDTFTSKKYVVAMNEAIVSLANAVEELLRHVATLRSEGVDIIVEIVEKISSLRESHGVDASGKLGVSTTMDMDSEIKENERGRCLVSSEDSAAPEGVSDDQFIQLLVFHLMVLVHRSMENTETCRIFVEKSGIDALLKLLLQPSIAQSSEGMSIALHSTMVFKGFTQHHSAPLARAFCSALREHLKKALAGFLSCGTFLLDPSIMSPDESIFSSLSLVEFLLFLAASKDSRWVTALLTEFGNGSKDVLEDIGRIQREITWQISLLEDAKLEIEEEMTGTSAESQSDGSAYETEEQRFGQRFNTFRQFLDPLLRRRSSGWSVESQFFELMNLYSDIGRSTSFHQRLSSDGPSSIRTRPRFQSESSDALGKKDIDKQRAYYASCCDMVRSLSFHITHLFQELGKVMLLPSRRREDTINMTPASKSVASTFSSISLDHMNFGSNVSVSGSQSSISAKCRYFGKVVDFIDGIFMDRLDSCNPALLNCFYGHGVIQSVLTTFEATSQLLFTVKKAPSPMETDDGIAKQDLQEADSLWLYGPLASYGKLMDHLVTSSFILSPSTKHLLSQPLISSEVPFPRDADTFVKVLHSMVLKAVLPVWTHPQFADCNNDFITTVISIIKHIFSGIEVKSSNSNISSRITGPPPSEATISTIVEMGFSRSRAEEALSQVGSNSVELAMEWLFSHPEEVQEDDELARALAMSLGNSESETRENPSDESSQRLEAEAVQLPTVEDLLSTCMKLLQMKESLAFPVHDLLMKISSQNDGQYRSTIVTCVVEQIKSSGSVSENRNNIVLSSLFHVLALTLNEDVAAQEIALKNGLIELAVDLLSKWNSDLLNEEKNQVPKWVTAAFLAIDRMVQADHKLNAEILDNLKKDDASLQQNSVKIGDDTKTKLQSALGLSTNHINIQEQNRLIEIACRYLRCQLPSETMHAVLQLCAALTRTHSVAVSFLEARGLSSLLSLPSRSLFPGFDSIAATIICHVLEDPQTLQQAMESEIKHSLVAAANRHSTGRVSARNFLLNLTSVISRDPVIFMLAAQSVCQIEMVGERPYIVLLKDREKEKSKDKEKDKDKDKGKQQTGDGKLSLGINTACQGTGQAKSVEVNSRSTKTHRKYPQSFVTVIELLLDAVSSFEPPLLDEANQNSSSATEMDIDVAVAKGKGKAIMDASNEDDASIAEASTSIAKVGFILKLLTEIILMYATSVHVLLRKDVDQRGSSTGIFCHILRKFLPCAKVPKKDKKVDSDWRQKLSTRSSQFLVASCVRSAEARRRVFSEITYLLNDFVASLKSGHVTGSEVQVFVDLLNDILAARSPTGSYISAEASATFVDTGLVKSFTQILKVLDLDHSDSPKVVTGLIKALDLVSKEHFTVSSTVVKGESAMKPPDNNQSGRTDNNGEVPGSMEAVFQSNNESSNIENVEPFNVVNNYGGSEAVTDDMEHDQDFDGGSPPVSEDDYMHETSEEARGIGNGIDSVSLQFEIQPHVQENIDEDDDEDMSGDDGDEGDEDDEDDGDHNDLEEDEVHHLPHPDMHQDDQDIDDDDGFDEEVLEEDDEDDEDDEDGVILRLEEGINGINVFDHIEVLGRNHSFTNETVRLMPVEVFGSRRQGRTTSIYDLLGRAGSSAVPSRHPLLTRLAQSSSSRQTESVSDVVLHDRNIGGTTSRLDVIFRSLRSGRHGHRLNLWVDDNQRSSGSSAATIPQGLEELLASHLRRPSPGNPSSLNAAADIQNEVGDSRHQNSEGGVTPDINVSSSTDRVGDTALTAAPGSANADMDNVASETHQSNITSVAHTQAIEMQLESNVTVVRDVEAVSQESGGSGATLGESLRSLDVEIGSADGQDDGGERQGGDRTSLGDQQSIRPRRAHTSTGTSTANAARDAPLQCVTEVPENSREAEEDGPSAAPQISSDAAAGAIDPAFLDALPEELRAEVLSAQQGQVAQPATADLQTTGDIDPEFLAALPPDIRAEVLAQQQAQRLHQSQELEGQPVEMDTVSIIATFPADLREEVLLTSSDAILANLTPALVAEANMLRERFAHRYHNRALFGMYPRSRRGESSRRAEGSGSGLERSGGGIGSRKSIGAKFVEVDGAPLVDTEAVQAMIRILRVVQPLYKGQLQRLLLNLCSHSETRSVLVKVLMGMLVPDTRRPINHGDAVEPSFRLYGCQNNVMYSRPQSVDGIPPLVSRRVLETMTYLARNHPFVARILLQLRLSRQAVPKNVDHARGKIVANVGLNEDCHPDGYLPIELLLQLLNQPLYSRSVAHLEQLLSLLEVIIDNAESKHATPDKSGDSSMASMVPQAASSGAEHIELERPSILNAEAAVMVDSGKTTSEKQEIDAQLVLASLPQAELRLLCSLLAKEGMSDNAYSLVAEVVKKLVIAAPSHGRLFTTELVNAIQTQTKSAMNELHVFSEAVKALLSMASSEGASVLRVLQALSSLVTTLLEKKKEKQIGADLETEYSAVLNQVWEINSTLDPLWLELSNCINKIESYSESTLDSAGSSKASRAGQSGTMTPLPAGAQNILPYIESFFVVAEKLHPAQAGSGQDSGAPSTSESEDSNTTTDQLKSPGTSVKFDEKHAVFVKFSERHRKLLNAFIRQNPALLEKSFSLLLKVPRFIDFDNKRSHFRSKIKHQHDHHHSPLRISVRRAYILEDSYNQLRLRSTQDLKGRLTVHFQGEEGIDAGGLTREWYQLLSRVIFDKGALLFTTVGNESTFQPNPNSGYQTEHLSYFKFVGRVVGKALFDGQLLDVHFTRSFYKHILGVKVTYNDIEAIDPDYFKNLKWMLENDITDVLDLTFSIDADEEKLILYERNEVTDHELMPNGRNVKVTEENKHQYVDLVAKHRLTTAIRPQINAFLEGFGELIPRDLISIFNDKELELLISGLPDIDLDDLRANTEYSGYSAASPAIRWFWEVVQGFSEEEKARLLQFVTGTSKVPLDGFSALHGISGSQKFQIHKAYGSPDHLPSAHTCFNQLDMPEYPSKEQLEERLLLAIHEGNEGFGFG
ncbi:hypothetical protein MLD38_022393 [Melastoma candidum]|uniref:Uncharacterized protein n=1 Tax=Melastoma candidum TaxID=119954 RepID=A0ACB9QIZ5_9MYRT|nr:hypothetical protein MLD38_022393 [Melastoma candidum]